MNRFDPYENTSGPLDNYQDSLELNNDPLSNYSDPMTRVDPFADNPGLFNEIINWSHDPMNKPQNQNKYFFSDGKTYYEQICKMLKLMAVFKDAFNQIYDNEDEIHEAWENFVENLSATATAGDEASVTLTWTDESVQFEFVMPKGQKGDKGDQGDPGQDGVSISNIAFNADYTMTITLSNGNTYTSPSLKGEKGDTGEGLEILDIYATLAELEQAHPTGQPGDAYLIGTDPNYTLYIWSTSQNDWLPAGSLTAPSPSTSTPLMDGTASTGSENAYSRGDHVHPTDTSRASASDLTALSGTVTNLGTTVGTISGNVTQLQSDMTGAQGDITQLQSDLSDAEGNITQLQSDVTDIAGDVTDITTVVSGLLTDVGTLSDDLTVLEDIVTGSNDLDDQQFLYRKAPTDHDTIARINSIKGNTVSFNQLAHGNFANTSEWVTATCTFSVSNNQGTMKATAQYGGVTQNIDTIVGHKYFICVDALSSSQSANIRSVNGGINASSSKTSWEHFAFIITATNTTTDLRLRDGASSNWTDQYFKNAMFFDLTLMGIDNLTTTAEVEAYIISHLGNLDYFGFTLGTLIPFMGTGLKTTGKNLIDVSALQDGGLDTNTGEEVAQNTVRRTPFINVFPNTTYVLSGLSDELRPYFYRADKSFLYRGNLSISTIAIPNDCYFIRFQGGKATWTGSPNVQFEIGSIATTYEPYTSNTLSLPTLTYFPDGMKSAGSVYDELSDKAYTRVIKIDLGEYDYFKEEQSYIASGYCFTMSGDGIKNLIKKPSSADSVVNALSPIYEVVSQNYLLNTPNLNMCICCGTTGAIRIINKNYSDASAFKTAMSGQYLYFEMETPTETDISLDLTYPVWNGGTEQIVPINDSTPDTAPIRGNFSYMSTDEAIQYLYDHISASVQAELDDLDDRVTDTETAISTMQTDISGLQTDLSTLFVIEEHDYGFGNVTAGQNLPYSGASQSVTGYTAVGIVGSKIYRMVDDTSYYANGMVLDYAFIQPTTYFVTFNIMNATSATIENVRMTLYVLYIKDNGGN